MKYPSNIIALSKLQPDFMGFIFHKSSKRYFKGVIPELPPSILKIGVFVDISISDILNTVIIHKLNGVQLHGKESEAYIERLRSKCHELQLPLTIIKVFAIDNQFNFDSTLTYQELCDYFLFDTKGPLPGGNGFTFDWKKLDKYQAKTPFFLSGGIGNEHKIELDKFMNSSASRQCIALDVNSKFEVAPGKKNITSLTTFKQFCDEL